MLTLVLIIVITVGVIGLGYIIVPKLSLVARVDISSLPAEKEAQKKREIILKRIEAEGSETKRRLVQRLQPLRKWWGRLQLSFRVYMGRIERLWRHEQTVKFRRAGAANHESSDSNKLESLLSQGKQFVKQNRFEQAEEVFIAAITLDKRSPVAYRGLAETYFAKGAIVEAEETYKFLAQLSPDDDALYVKLAEIAEMRGKVEDAIQYLQQAVVLNDSLSPRFYHLAELLLKIEHPEIAKEAVLSAVELEPKNPKYLDLLLETGILCNDKALAFDAFQELRLVNPENHKLAVFAERMKELK